MKKLLFLLSFVLILLLSLSCSKLTEVEQYKDVDCTIMSFNGSSVTECRSVLLQLDGTNLYCELSTCDYYPIIEEFKSSGCDCGDNSTEISKWFYNHKVGDKLHFDYINKARFFEIKAESYEEVFKE